MTVFYCQFDLVGHRLEHPEHPEGFYGFYKDFTNMVKKGHENAAGLATTDNNMFYVFVDKCMLGLTELDFEWVSNCFRCDYSGKCGIDQLLEQTIQQLTITTVHELIHLSTPQRLMRDHKEHENQTSFLTRKMCDMGCQYIPEAQQ